MSQEIKRVRPAVPVPIGGKERHLKLDLNAMASFEEATGKSVFALDVSQLGAKDLRALLWACLLHEDKKLTPEEVGSWITLENMQDVAAGISAAFAAAMPAKPESADASPPPPPPEIKTAG